LDFWKFQEVSGAKALLCGGSTVFGVGATSDASTIPSVLNRDSDMTWFNFGGMGHTSTQELLMYLMFRPESDHVVILSGINNLTIHLASPHFSDVYGSIFSQSLFQILNRIGSHRQYLQYLSGRVLDRLISKFRPNGAPDSKGANTASTLDLDQRYQSSLKITARDLDVWAMLRDQLGFTLTFVLQPISVWMSKSLSPEEAELIGQLDVAGRRQWGESGDPVLQYLSDAYPRYRSDLQGICETRGIKWADCNTMLPDEGWIFCDRTHLTDHGNELVSAAIQSVFETNT